MWGQATISTPLRPDHTDWGWTLGRFGEGEGADAAKMAYIPYRQQVSEVKSWAIVVAKRAMAKEVNVPSYIYPDLCVSRSMHS